VIHTDGNMVVIVESNKVAEFQVTSCASSLAGNTLHSTTITEDGVCVVVEKLIAGLVEHTSAVSLGNGKTNGVGETLTERTGCDLNTRGLVGLRVTWGDTAELL
jgi:hypothetical protein